MSQTYQGACHCGRVRFELNARLDHVIDCNCSLCHKRGALWHGAADDSLRILAGAEELSLYQYGTMTGKHYFCRHCGIHPFVRPRLAPDAWAVNVRCLDGVDPAALPVQPFDGRNWDEAAKKFLESRPRG